MKKMKDTVHNVHNAFMHSSSLCCFFYSKPCVNFHKLTFINGKSIIFLDLREKVCVPMS